MKRLRRVLNPWKATREAEGQIEVLGKRVSGLHDEAAKSKAAVEDAVERMAKAEKDIGLSQAAERAAKEEAAQVYQQYGGPEKFKELIDSHRRRGLYATGGTILGLGGLAGVPIAHYAGQRAGEADKTRTRNIAFGVGTAAGLAAPQVIQGLGNVARGVSSTGLYPELEGFGGPAMMGAPGIPQGGRGYY